MIDRNNSLGSLLAGLMWATSAAVLALAWVLALPYLGMVGVALTSVAATFTIRGMMNRQQEMLRDAFSLGRDSAGESVRRMR